jgi:putative ABC transport system permease protein
VATAQKLLNTQRCPAWACFWTAWNPPTARRPCGGANPKLQVQTWEDQAFFYQAVRDLYNRIFGALGLIIG